MTTGINLSTSTTGPRGIDLGVAIGGSAAATSAPTAKAISQLVLKDTAWTFDLIGCGGEGALTYAIASSPSNGVLSTVGFPSITYTPTTGYTGADSFTYTVSDGAATSAASSVTVEVAGGAYDPLTIFDVGVFEADVGIGVADGANVTAWANRQTGASGCTDLANATVATQPTFRAAASANGMPSVQFETVNDVLDGTYNHAAALAQPCTIALVLEPVNVSSVANFIDSPGSRLTVFRSSGSVQMSTGSLNSTDITVATGQTKVIVARFNEAASVCDGSRFLAGDWKRDVTVTVGAGSMSALRAGANVNGNSGAFMHMHAIYVASRLLTDAEAFDLSVYASVKWGA